MRFRLAPDRPERYVIGMIRYLLPAVLFAVVSCQAEEKKKERETSTGRIIDVEDDDKGMNDAMAQARKEFPTFWKAVSEDRKKEEPELLPAMVKASFGDPGDEEGGEHLWIDEVSYDGKMISGVVASAPADLKSVKLGEKVKFPLERLSDWLFVEKGVAKGAFTVNYLRKQMSAKERKEHDESYPFRFPPLK
jgi:uncharacterized protein YegJ (DUF2314 family)